VLENKEIEGPLSSTVVIERRGLDPWTLYLYSMKSPATKEKYLMRLEKFLDFLNIEEGGILEDKSRALQQRIQPKRDISSITSRISYSK
jgi:hypothetical protein